MSMLKLQGALLRGTESLRLGLRSYSLTRMKEEARKKILWEQVELMEVLEARVKQLLADHGSEVLMDPVPASGARRAEVLPPTPLPKAPGQNSPAPTLGQSSAARPSRWMEKLRREKLAKPECLRELPTGVLSAPLPQKQRDTPLEKGPAHKRTKHGPAKVSLAAPAREADLESLAATPEPGRTPKASENKPAERKPEPAGKAKGQAIQTEAGGPASPKPLAPAESEKVDRNIQLSLLAYLDTCLHLQQPDRAHRCLAYYHRAATRRAWLDIRMYNLVLHGHAKKGAIREVGTVFQMIEEARLKPNLDSYAAQAMEHGYSLEELFQGGSCQKDEEEMMLRAIRAVQPGFQRPQALVRTENCTVPLLRDFYAKDSQVSYPKLDFTARDLRERFRNQLAMELGNTVTVESVEKKPVTERTLQARKLLAALRTRWRVSLLKNFQESKRQMEMQNPRQLSLYPFLCLMPAEEYVDILMQMLSMLPPPGQSLVILARDLGNKIHSRYLTQKKICSREGEKMWTLYKRYIQLLAKDTKPDHLLPRQYWEALAAKEGCDFSQATKGHTWPISLLVQLGVHLLELLVQTLKVESNLLMPTAESKLIPAVYHVYSFRGSWQVGFIRLHPIVNRLFAEAAETNLAFDAAVIPMLCPPVPWVSPHFGAYVVSPTKLMRFLDGTNQHQRALEDSPRADLFSAFDALNQLGNCPWKINRPILELAIAVFNAKGSEKLGVPPPPSEAPEPPKRPPKDQEPPTKAELKREIAQCRKKAAEMYSMRMDMLYKLSIARHVAGQVFWFPHNMDFRGRTYPCPPHFNHLGSDLTRAILLFAEGKPLGPHGLDWLKIHLVNLTGQKKRSSLAERLAYANEILGDILDSANQPLTGRKWWMEMDEPWQTLACSMEIAKAMRSPNPEAYVSHFPVHQLTSVDLRQCREFSDVDPGRLLQRAATLRRPRAGRGRGRLRQPFAVRRPQDVYSVVAQQVEVFRQQDAKNGLPIAQALEGFISRKVVKQTVMTVVYGVTRYGGRLQIEKRLKEIDDFPQKYVWEASHYLVQQVFNSLREMFSGTREIQAWLTECAMLISKSGRVVEWVTPLGLPVIQPYYRSKSLTVKSSMQNVNLKLSYDVNQKPNTLKQKNAFPPNFIHSLDSTHMMLTALHCHQQGLTFVSVHDCYWTHARTVDVMNQICRDQFVRLHQQPILEDLSCFMLQKYCPRDWTDTGNDRPTAPQKLMKLLSNIPSKGDFDLEKVKESTYFFS
ncbi:hypothetical protein JRQ81_009029 [Phrynocephalus forsythii]|uniref:DNA-directed RNA polymerase, mitochondrial n=1 Tax=Phrynocephalus forsythii TaxID=171643 RepID=A0A9Q0XEH3_9SAUR|nr:hypothetical protein JRQ81_009029 [Phrynocephalus forsythii]